MPPVFGSVRLGEHAADLVSVLHQPLQGRHREFRCAHKQDSHSSLVSLFLPADVLLQLLLGQQMVRVLHKQMTVQMLDLMAEGSGPSVPSSSTSKNAPSRS